MRHQFFLLPRAEIYLNYAILNSKLNKYKGHEMPSQENKPSARELDSASPLKTQLVSSDSNIVALVEKYLEKIKKSSHSTRFPESKIRSQLLILICNLIWVNRKNNQWIYQGRGKPSFSHTRYFHTLTHDIFVKRVLNNLVCKPPLVSDVHK